MNASGVHAGAGLPGGPFERSVAATIDAKAGVVLDSLTLRDDPAHEIR